MFLRKKVLDIYKVSRIYAFLFISFFLVFLYIFLNIKSDLKQYKNTEDQKQKIKLENLDLVAKSVFVYDLMEDEILYSKNEYDTLPIASITKLMTVYCGLTNFDSQSYVLVPGRIYEYNEVQNLSSTNEYITDEYWKFGDLSIYTLIESSNIGAEVISKTVGEENMIQCMNTKAIEMGLFNTRFYNVTGLDINIDYAGAYSNAVEVSVMLKRIYSEYPEFISRSGYNEYVIYSKNGKIHRALNTNLVTSQTIGILASKTGTTDLAGANLAYITNVGLDHKIIVVLLGSTIEDRFADALKINKSILQSFLK